MTKKEVSGITLTLLLIGVLTLAFNIQPIKASLPVHNIDTDSDYATIQEAIDAMETLNGHTIFVDAGIYHEHVVVDKSLSLIGADQSTPIVDGGEIGNVVTITADGVNITGFTIQNSGGFPSILESGIYISYSSGSNISYNIITGNNHGILGYSSRNNVVSGNNITANDCHGVYFKECSNYNTICGNNISGKPITSSAVGVKLAKSDHNIVSGNTMSNHTEEGVEFDMCNYNAVSGNNITSNWGGIQLWGSSFNDISGNAITHNGRWGIFFDHNSDTNNITGNTIANHNIGLDFAYGGSHNRIYHNNFINNTHQALPDPGDYNSWDNGPSGGNYWSDYEDKYPAAQEIDGSGIWDTPYFIDENNVDRYPFMNESGWETRTPEQAVHDLIDIVESMNLQQGIDNSLDAKLTSALDALEALNADQRNDAINKLNAFINEVEAQREKKLTNEQADYLIAAAQEIIDLITG